MFLVLQSLLFCLVVAWGRQPSNINSTDCDKTVNSIINADISMADTNIKVKSNHDYSWLALGDSYTIGESVKEDERFPAQTIYLLKKDNFISLI